jgi:hypothetical protein
VSYVSCVVWQSENATKRVMGTGTVGPVGGIGTVPSRTGHGTLLPLCHTRCVCPYGIWHRPGDTEIIECYSLRVCMYVQYSLKYVERISHRVQEYGGGSRVVEE